MLKYALNPSKLAPKWEKQVINARDITLLDENQIQNFGKWDQNKLLIQKTIEHKTNLIHIPISA